MRQAETRMMTQKRSLFAALTLVLLGSYLALAQQAQRGGQPGQQAQQGQQGQGRGQAQQRPMSFFVTSVGMSKGGDLGGLAGADAHCRALATAVGAANADRTWRAYLSTQDRPGQPAVNARDRIGQGPWYNTSFAQLGQRQNAIISQNLSELHGDTLVQAQRGSNLFKQSARTEYGQVIRGVGDPPPIQHDILTGSQPDGRAFTDPPAVGRADHTCNNWTSSGEGSAQVGHSDRIGNMNASWTSSHATSGCSQAALGSTGGAGLFYCFAVN